MTKSQKKVIKPGKAITASKADGIKKKLLKVPEQAITTLVLDFAKVESVDAVGLGVILAAHNTMKSNGGSLELINVPEGIYGLFETMHLKQHFEIQAI